MPGIKQGAEQTLAAASGINAERIIPVDLPGTGRGINQVEATASAFEQ